MKIPTTERKLNFYFKASKTRPKTILLSKKNSGGLAELSKNSGSLAKLSKSSGSLANCKNSGGLAEGIHTSRGGGTGRAGGALLISKGDEIGQNFVKNDGKTSEYMDPPIRLPPMA